MNRNHRRRYMPPAELVRENRRAVRARALRIARAERNDTRAQLRDYYAGVLS